MESDIEAPGASGLTINDHVNERGPEDTGQGELSSGKKRTVFPYHITSELRSLYKGGMTGVGIQYSSLIDAACERTGLTRAQVKVSNSTCRYIHAYIHTYMHIYTCT